MNEISNYSTKGKLQQCENSEPRDVEVNKNLSAREFCGLSLQDLDDLYAVGYAAWNDGDIDCAAYYFSYLSLLNPSDYRFIFAFACALKKKGEYHHALNLFQHAMSMLETTDSSALHIAVCFQHLGEINKAREVLNAFISRCFERTNDLQCGLLRQQAETLLLSINN